MAEIQGAQKEPRKKTEVNLSEEDKKSLSPGVLKIINDLHNQVEILTQAADKGRLENVLGKNKTKIHPIVKVSFYENNLVVAWRSVMDEVYKDSDGTWHERQLIEITTRDADGNEKPVQLDYSEFQRLLEKRPATIISRKQTEHEGPGETTYVTEVFRVKMNGTGEEIILDGAFIN